MNRNQRRMAAFNAKKATEKRFESKICELLIDCSPRVDRATSLCSLRDKPEQELTGSACLPEVALFAAGHRKSKQVTAR
ncbi:transcriptional regulator [Raoultella ornithinolytica]|uniref:transcriptional antitermination N peptide n=1 Tax=Raoultella ornithinolytica TaxID=54291 RepID=UPI002FEED2D3